VVAFLFAINMLASPEDLWFQWPALIIVFVYALRMILMFRKRIA